MNVRRPGASESAGPSEAHAFVGNTETSGGWGVKQLMSCRGGGGFCLKVQSVHGCTGKTSRSSERQVFSLTEKKNLFVSNKGIGWM